MNELGNKIAHHPRGQRSLIWHIPVLPDPAQLKWSLNGCENAKFPQLTPWVFNTWFQSQAFGHNPATDIPILGLLLISRKAAALPHPGIDKQDT